PAPPSSRSPPPTPTAPHRNVWLLVSLAGVAQVLVNSQVVINFNGLKAQSITLAASVTLAVAVVMGPVLGALNLLIGSTLMLWTGRWLNGQAFGQTIKAAWAWSSVPTIWGLWLWIPQLVVYSYISTYRFSRSPSVTPDDLRFTLVVLTSLLVQIVITLWGLVVFLQCLRQVQGFSAWKALGNALLAGLVFTAPWVIIGILAAALS
ncbi:MAG: YIP1 family protein, partial [Candidatus Competibacterales bacterium]